MKSHLKKLIETLELIVKNGPNETDQKVKSNSDSNVPAITLRRIATSLLDSSDVQEAIERLDDWPKRKSDLREAIDYFFVEYFLWETSQKHLETIAEIATDLKSDPDPNTFVNDPIIKARIELLQRLTIDEVNDTVTFDNHSYSVSCDAAKLFMLIRQQFPRLVVVSQHEIRLDRLKLPPELERLLDKVGKNGVSIKLPNDCQKLA